MVILRWFVFTLATHLESLNTKNGRRMLIPQFAAS